MTSLTLQHLLDEACEFAVVAFHVLRDSGVERLAQIVPKLLHQFCGVPQVLRNLARQPAPPRDNRDWPIHV